MMEKRLISILLAAGMMLTLLPATALAADETNITSAGLDFSGGAPNETTRYTTDGGGTVTWEPTPSDGSPATGGTLTFTNANINCSEKKRTGHIVKLPTFPVNVVLNGTNDLSISTDPEPIPSPVPDTGNATYDVYQYSAFLCGSDTTFTVNGETNLTVENNLAGCDAYAINNKAHNITVNGPGTLNMSTTVSDNAGKAEIRSNNVTLRNGVTMSGVVKPANGSGTIRLGNIITPAGKTLDYSAMGTPIRILDADASWYDASATEFTLTTPEQLAGLVQLCNADFAASPFAGKTVKLGADIDLAGYDWTPIWWNAGTFDGQGHAITGLNVTRGVSKVDTNTNMPGKYSGLFAYAENGSQLCNFTVSGNIVIDIKELPTGHEILAGGVVGRNVMGTLINLGSNVNVDVKIPASNNYNYVHVGGIAGETTSGTFSNCILNSYASGTIKAQGGRECFAGGIAGFTNGDPIINCYYGGNTVTAASNDAYSHPCTAGITLRWIVSDEFVSHCFSGITGKEVSNFKKNDGDTYTTAASLLASLNESDVHAQIQTDHNVTPLPWKMGTNGMPVLAFPPQEQFTLTPGGTYWFDLSAQEIPGTVNGSLPDRSLHYVPFTYAGTVDAYVLKAASSDVLDSSVQAAAATADPGATYGYRYDHSLFVSDHNVTHENSNQTDYIYAGSWTSLNSADLIFGKAYASGGVSYTLRAPSAGSSYTGSDWDRRDRRGAPAANEWDAVLDRSADYIKHWNPLYSWGQDTDATTYTSRAYRGRSSARCWNSDFKNVWDDLGLYGYRPVLEVPSTLPRDGLKAVTLNLNGGSVGGNETINIIVRNGADFTPPSSMGLTRPAGNTGTYFQWKDENGSLYLPDVSGVSIPSSVTTLTAVWALDDAGVAAVSVNGMAGTISGTTISVVLSCGALLPTEASAVSITPATGATVSTPSTADGGRTWTFTVTAENGVTQKTYTINVSVAAEPTPAPASDSAPAADPNFPVNGAVYNAERTIWLTGGGIADNDLLIVESNPNGSEYGALRALANGAEVFNAYNIYLRSGKKSIGSAIYLHFDLNERYAGQAFTLVHQKADKTCEYFTASADAKGDLAFGPLYELSPFMLVKGTLAQASNARIADVPATGGNAAPGACIAILLLADAALAVGRKRKRS